ncbi:hypothetical protein TIFTF001_039341 [Ficus carica]|uniref:Ubiquitin-like protease family profile domain-containing protein n=1 Tax=Ficus carica TaxID=3494 RepID=A0AA88E3P7_FICCA|nr:hypothetical protein TIFTF001_036409 [Ficus carica]GMN70301.1 hypothetical protein TIFTF001_039341 [Ficus carica]
MLEDLKKAKKHSNKLLRRILKMLSANMIEKGQGKAQTALHVSNSQEINVQRVESDAFKTTSPDIGVVADMGVQAAMEFLIADKVMSSHEDAENEKNKEESMPDLEKSIKEEKYDKEIIREQDVIKLEEPANEENIGAVIPKKKRARLSRLGQRPSGRMTEVGSPSKAPSKLIYALPPGLADEPTKETLEEFRDKRPPRYNVKHETLDKPHDLGFMVVDKKSWYYKLATSSVWLWDEHIDVAFYYLRKKIRQFPELEQRKVTTVDTFFSSKVRSLWHVYQSSPDKFDWGSLKLDLTSWTIEVYDSLQHEGPHNSKVREGVECISKFIPLLAEKLSLFDFKPREPLGTYPIPVTIMKDIPQQANGDDCGMFTIKYTECLIEGRDVRYWVIHECMQLFREWLTCYFWSHAKRNTEQNYKSDDDVDLDFA